MLAEKRRAMILERIRDVGAESCSRLAQELGSSYSTIRRDLDRLAITGEVTRTRSGATLRSFGHPCVAQAGTLGQAPSRLDLDLGREAAGRLRSRETVFVEGSPITIEMIRIASERGLRMTLVTNDLGLAGCGSRGSEWQVVVPGGTVRPGTHHLGGEQARRFLKTIFVDACFIAECAVAEGVLASGSVEGASMKKAIVAAARRRILVARGADLDAAAFAIVCELSAVHEVITDDGISPGTAASVRASGVSLTIVPSRREAYAPRASGRSSSRPSPPDVDRSHGGSEGIGDGLGSVGRPSSHEARTRRRRSTVRVDPSPIQKENDSGE